MKKEKICKNEKEKIKVKKTKISDSLL